MHESPLAVHEVELVVEACPGLGNSGRVGDHAHRPLSGGHGAAGDHGGRLVVDAHLGRLKENHKPFIQIHLTIQVTIQNMLH